MKKKVFVFVAFLLLLTIVPVNAKEINHFHALANDNISFKDVVKGDSAIAGNLVDVLGNIDGIGFVAGNTVNINGELEYGFVAGNNISINGNIGKSIYVAGNKIIISNDAKINRDAFIVGNDITLSGNINRDVSIGASVVTIKSDAKISGNVSLTTEKLVIQDGASITGTLKYNEDAKKEISNNANIGKVATYSQETTDDSNNYIDVLSSILNMIVVFVVLATVLPKCFSKTTGIYEESNNYFKGIGIGLLILICVPIVCLFLLISSIGISLGLILAVLYGVGIYISYVIAGFILGDTIITKLLKQDINNYFIGVIGIIIMKLLILVPVIGGFVSVIALTIGLYTIGKLIISDKNDKNKKVKVIEADIKKKKN